MGTESQLRRALIHFHNIKIIIKGGIFLKKVSKQIRDEMVELGFLKIEKGRIKDVTTHNRQRPKKKSWLVCEDNYNKFLFCKEVGDLYTDGLTILSIAKKFKIEDYEVKNYLRKLKLL